MINTIFDFDLFFVYLSGPIQYASDGGISWRIKVTQRLKEIGIPEKQILDPCNKPMNTFDGKDLDSDLEYVKKLRAQGKWEEVENFVRHTIRIDLRLVDKSDLIYMHVDPNTHTCGTYDEMSVARTQKKPVIAVVDGGLEKAPLWLVGRIGAAHIFPSDDEALKYIEGVMKGHIGFDPKSWLFFDTGKKYDTKKD